MSLLSDSKHGKNHRQHGFRKPYENPASRGGLMGGHHGRSERGKSDGNPAPAWNGGERACALHGLADKAKIVCSTVFQGNQHRSRTTGRLCRGHTVEDKRGLRVVKFFAAQSERGDSIQAGLPAVLPEKGYETAVIERPGGARMAVFFAA